jgi:hypothetical protein
MGGVPVRGASWFDAMITLIYARVGPSIEPRVPTTRAIGPGVAVMAAPA